MSSALTFRCPEWYLGEFNEQGVRVYQLHCTPTSVPWVHDFAILNAGEWTGLSILRVAPRSEDEMVEAFFAGHSGQLPKAKSSGITWKGSGDSLWTAALAALSAASVTEVYVAPSKYFENHYGRMRSSVNAFSAIEVAAFVLMDTYGDDPLLVTDYESPPAPYGSLGGEHGVMGLRPLVDKQMEFLTLRRDLMAERQAGNREALLDQR